MPSTCSTLTSRLSTNPRVDGCACTSFLICSSWTCFWCTADGCCCCCCSCQTSERRAMTRAPATVEAVVGAGRATGHSTAGRVVEVDKRTASHVDERVDQTPKRTAIARHVEKEQAAAAAVKSDRPLPSNTIPNRFRDSNHRCHSNLSLRFRSQPQCCRPRGSRTNRSNRPKKCMQGPVPFPRFHSRRSDVTWSLERDAACFRLA